MGKVTSSKDLLMLLLYAKGHTGEQCEPIRGRTRLMKMVFLFEKEVRRSFNMHKVIPDSALPDFTPYDYGPFSPQVFSDLEFLVEMDFVKVARVGQDEPLPEEALEYEYWQAGAGPSDVREDLKHEQEFSLSDIGQGFVREELAGELSQDQWSTLDEFKSRCTGASLRALLRYVYTKYPRMTSRSTIRDEIVSDYRY